MKNEEFINEMPAKQSCQINHFKHNTEVFVLANCHNISQMDGAMMREAYFSI